MKRRYIAIIAALTVGTLAVNDANAQIFRFRCANGSCQYRSSQISYAPLPTAAPCEPAQTIVDAPEPCEPAQTVVEPCEPAQTAVEPCAPVETTAPEPCEPVQTTAPEPCEPVQTTCEGCDQVRDATKMVQVGECVGGTCPIRRIVGGTVDAVQTVAATARFLAAANALRARYGLAPLQADVGLDAACKGQVGICARRGALIHGAGAAEILAQNTSGFEFAVSQWAASRSGHAELLLNPSFRFAGVAMERDANGRYWCAMRFR